jgi:uncharacterized protein (TIGR02147 family)
MVKTNLENLEQVRMVIQQEFIERSRKNPAYSLRAFAKYLEIDQSYLSKLLKGQRPITKNLVESIVPKLGIKQRNIEMLFTKKKVQMADFALLTDDQFELLSEWQHFAIVELAKTKGFVFNSTKIAQRLGLHVEEVRSSIARLERLGLIEIQGEKVKVLLPTTTWSNTKRTSIARQKFQKAALNMAADAVENISFEKRDSGSITMAVSSERLPEFKEKLKQIRQELAAYFQPKNSNDLDEVYQLVVSFYPLTKENK